MTDIVEQLRLSAQGTWGRRELLDEAAAEIELLQAALREVTQERDDAEARGEAMHEKLQPALTIAEAEISRLTAALEEIDTVVRSDEHHARIAEITRAALSGKGES